MRLRAGWGALLVGAGLLTLAGCKSQHVEVTVQNNTGAEVRLLEVDYPSASFGADSIPAGGSMHYRIQVQGSGKVKVQYTGTNEKQFQSTGPELREGVEGKLAITLEPDGKAEFAQTGRQE